MVLARLRPGRPEDGQHTHYTVQSMTRAGYPPREAQHDNTQYRARLREAITSWRATLLSGFLTGVVLGLSIVSILALGALVMWGIQIAASGGGETDRGVIERSESSTVQIGRSNSTPSEPIFTKSRENQVSIEPLLGFIQPAMTLAIILGLALTGLAAIERMRQRRQGAHQRYGGRGNDSQYLAHQFLLWVCLLGLLAALIRLTFGPREAGAFIGLGIAVGFPASFIVRYYFYRMYPTVLAVVSEAHAGTESRRIVESELATTHTQPTIQEFSWSGTTDITKQRSETVNKAGQIQIKPRYLMIYVLGLIGWWGFIRWWGWISSDAPAVPFTGDLRTDINGIVVGSLLGWGLTRIYRNFIDDL